MMTPADFPDELLSDAHSGSKIRVLLAEDDDVDAERVERILGQGNEFELQRVKSLAKAFLIIANNDVDLIQLDLGLSDCSSLDAIQSLRRVSSAKIIVLSGMDENSSVRSTALVNGADTFLSKFGNLERSLRWSIHSTSRGVKQVSIDSLRKVN